MISRWLKRTFIISWDDRRAKRWHLRWHYFLLSKNTENVSIHPWKTLLSYYLNTRTQGGHPASVWTVEPVYNLTRGTDRHQSWTPTLQCNTNLCPSTSPSWISFYWSHSVIMEKILWIKRLLDRGIHLFSSARPPVGYQTVRVQGEDRWIGNLWVPVWTARRATAYL